MKAKQIKLDALERERNIKNGHKQVNKMVELDMKAKTAVLLEQEKIIKQQNEEKKRDIQMKMKYDNIVI